MVASMIQGTEYILLSMPSFRTFVFSAKQQSDYSNIILCDGMSYSRKQSCQQYKLGLIKHHSSDTENAVNTIGLSVQSSWYGFYCLHCEEVY